MPLSLFGRDEDRPKKPSFFQRVRQAVTGEPATVPEPERAEATRPEPISPPAKIPAPVPLGATPEDAFAAPETSAELAEVEGIETPGVDAFALAGSASEPQTFEAPEEPLTVHDDARRPEQPTIHVAVTPPVPPARVASPSSTVQANEFGLRPMTTNFSFGGYASAEEEDASFLDRMRTAASRTRESLSTSLDSVLALGRTVDEDTLEELEAVLLTADLGVTTTNEVIGNLRARALREKADAAELKGLLREELQRILDSVQQPTDHPAQAPEVIMMVGVNGTGKTTTSGKLAALYGTHGRRALLCAADTFRAAAIEQLEVWAKRSNVDVIKTRQGGDPSAALYDALTAGKARGVDIVIVDTAGRLHNKAGLMAELDKMRRTAEKLVPGAPHQTFLVMDATTGQNGLQQARLFLESARVSGIVLTKLDGTAKGGVVLAIARELKLPVVFVGVGEKMEDILPFNSDNFLTSLLG
ncbi:signal recognition particle-docking protein FtsY [Terriglobus aquaticus]|uniref:Signal recognition particle receptor FtsY n=1 Tax=Terriglobus aquaticus TaxID=940139 RepID=A0ABW9KLH5_9BACT|nr:signal recognition particle-docking protein FtsY [Terriglobus aquaticus]